MKYLNRLNLGLLAAIVLLVSCHKNLDRFPTNDYTSDVVYSSEAGYKNVLAKVYGSMALTGNTGPAGQGDVAGIDEGTSDFLRLFWQAQVLTTDEAIVAWNDPGIPDFHNMSWSSSHPMLTGLYNRCFYIITLSNEFIRESTPEKVSGRNITGAAAANIANMRAEARFVRAFQYWVLMDLYGNPGFTDENTPIGASVLPKQIKRADLFEFIEAELLAIEAQLPAARTAEYGRVDKAAVWALMARMYLNAEVYTGTAKWTEAYTNAKKVIDAGYQLMPTYAHLFMADNNVNNTEVIWSLNYDGISSRNWGGTTYLVASSRGGGNTAMGLTGGLESWGGNRATKNLPELFPGYPSFTAPLQDSRAMFWTEGHTTEINSIGEFKEGLGVVKFSNRTRTGGFGKDPGRQFSDVDFPVFRLAEMYLIAAEAALRGGGPVGDALTYFNVLRARAYGNTSGNVGTVNLDLVLDERARELYWEGFRRSDLIRYNKFTEATYLWPWKGGIKNGTGVAAHRKIFPIPSTEVASNPNIKQNPNY